MFKITLFPAHARLLMLCAGFWDLPEAYAFQDNMCRIMPDALALGRPLRLLVILLDNAVPQASVVEVNTQTAELFQAVSIDRQALVTDSAILRLQVRRTLSATGVTVFSDLAAAADWLEWPLDELLRELDRDCEPARLHAAAG